MSHLTLIDCTRRGEPDDEDVDEHPPTWLCGTLHKERPFDQFVDAIELFQAVCGADPDTLYLHPDTYFWLSLHYSNFTIEDEPEPSPFWVELDHFISVVDIVVKRAPAVTKGMWFFVKTDGVDVDLSPWIP